MGTKPTVKSSSQGLWEKRAAILRGAYEAPFLTEEELYAAIGISGVNGELMT
jgi:hypothetical protein